MTSEKQPAGFPFAVAQAFVVLILIVVFMLLVLGCSSSTESQDVPSGTSAKSTVTASSGVDSDQLEQRDSVLAAIHLFWNTDPIKLHLWQERIDDACALIPGLKPEYQDSVIEAFAEEHCQSG